MVLALRDGAVVSIVKEKAIQKKIAKFNANLSVLTHLSDYLDGRGAAVV